MNKHKKLAIFIAPLLIIIGYIASDYYMEYKAENSNKLFELKMEGNCDILAQECILRSGEFKINIFDENGITTVNATFPLDSALLLVVSEDGQVKQFTLALADSPYYWKAKTSIREALANRSEPLKLRLIVTVTGDRYISEFYTQKY